MREKISKFSKDDIPILGIDESRFKSFIEEIHVFELDLRQYLNDSNMQDYLKIIPGTIGRIAECLRDIKVYAGDISDAKGNDHLKKAIGKINFSPKRERRAISRTSEKNKAKQFKKTLDDNSKGRISLHAEVIEEKITKKIERSMKVITPDISNNGKKIPKIHMKTKSKRNRYGYESKETGVNKIRNYKGIK